MEILMVGASGSRCVGVQRGVRAMLAVAIAVSALTLHPVVAADEPCRPALVVRDAARDLRMATDTAFAPEALYAPPADLLTLDLGEEGTTLVYTVGLAAAPEEVDAWRYSYWFGFRAGRTAEDAQYLDIRPRSPQHQDAQLIGPNEMGNPVLATLEAEWDGPNVTFRFPRAVLEDAFGGPVVVGSPTASSTAGLVVSGQVTDAAGDVFAPFQPIPGCDVLPPAGVGLDPVAACRRALAAEDAAGDAVLLASGEKPPEPARRPAVDLLALELAEEGRVVVYTAELAGPPQADLAGSYRYWFGFLAGRSDESAEYVDLRLHAPDYTTAAFVGAASAGSPYLGSVPAEWSGGKVTFRFERAVLENALGGAIVVGSPAALAEASAVPSATPLAGFGGHLLDFAGDRSTFLPLPPCAPEAGEAVAEAASVREAPLPLQLGLLALAGVALVLRARLERR